MVHWMELLFGWVNWVLCNLKLGVSLRRAGRDFLKINEPEFSWFMHGGPRLSSSSSKIFVIWVGLGLGLTFSLKINNIQNF